MGVNSSGKSSFLRVFPLLRQSVDIPTASPILWFGRYVDFGSLSEAANTKAAQKSVTLEASFDLRPANHSRLARFKDSADATFEDVFAEFRFPVDPTRMTIALTLGEGQGGEGTRIAAYDIRVHGSTIRLEFDDTGKATQFVVNELDVRPLTPELRLRGPAYFVPSVEQSPQDETGAVVFQPFTETGVRRQQVSGGLRGLTDPIVAELRTLFHNRVSEQRSYWIANLVSLADPARIKEHLMTLPGGKRWRERVGKLSAQRLKRINDLAVANSVPTLLRIADTYFAEMAASVSYTGPFRATAQRYYRIQDLSVREVDFRGENLAMFLRSLPEWERRSFSEFCAQHFSFRVEPRSDKAHVEIRIQERGAHTYVNLADMGFGYSQLLPLVAQLWSTFSRTPQSSFRRKPLRTLAIEQPELHLHPAHQARLADMFAGAISGASNLGGSLRLIIETHSEAIINRLGALIGNGTVKSPDVQVLLFEHNVEREESTVQFASYDDSGSLQNWPYGFLAPFAD